MALEQHIETLKKRHNDIDKMIAALNGRPFHDELEMGHLKKMKLNLKDDINRLEDAA